jgi:methionyl-tRNA formyltransferase
LLLRVVDELAAGTATAIEQSGEVTLAPKHVIDDARIDWNRPAAEVYNRLRGVTPEPGAFTVIGDARFKLLDAAPVQPQVDAELPMLPAGTIREHDKKVLIGTATEPLELLRVQPAGKNPMNAIDWWRGVATTEVVAS